MVANAAGGGHGGKFRRCVFLAAISAALDQIGGCRHMAFTSLHGLLLLLILNLNLLIVLK